MRETTRGRSTGLVLAAGAGMLLMYLLDRQQGRRRVALMRDQAVHLARNGSKLTDAGTRDLAHRATGIAAGLRAVGHAAPVDDAVLVPRIRSKMGRWTSHPHAIQVTASQGRVVLSGPVLHSEQQRLLRGIAKVRGVRAVEDHLEVHHAADGVPSLQGGAARSGPHLEVMQSNWSAGPRLLGTVVGTALALRGLTRPGVGGALLAIAGAALAARAATNIELTRMLGASGASRAVDIEKAIHIDAPRDKVFDLWVHAENFPRFMSQVENVRRLDATRSHWVVKGLAGSHLEWDAITSNSQRPEVLAWRTEAGAPLQHAGVVRFAEEAGGTRVCVRMSYNPPGCALGHAIARLLGRDPKQAMDADLMRMKAFIEQGRVAHDAARPDGPAAAPSSTRLGIEAFP